MAFKFKSRFKKRYWLAGIIALEVATIPVSAQIIGKISSFQKSLRTTPVVSVLIDETPGQKRYAIASQYPFYVSANNFEGPININLDTKAIIGGIKFGEIAQLPGKAKSCTIVQSPKQTIYQSERGTYTHEGHVTTQAVIMTVSFDTKDTPDINISGGAADPLSLDSKESCKFKSA